GFQGDEFDYQWQDSSTNSDFVAVETGIYELVVNNECGTAFDQFELTVLEIDAIETPLQYIYTLCTDDLLEIDLSNVIADFIQWNDGSTEKIRVLSEPGSYFVEFANICTDTLVSFILSKETCLDIEGIFIPNSFTPNNDAINDFFQIFINENWLSPEVKVSIYNRWGEEIFYSEEPDFTWDGSFRNKSLNSGVYAYYIEIEVEVDGEQKLIRKVGDITIIR
ncbi:gliding motility-associated C-terminal domain-containing protein, partial [Saprospiraceae bacterium]|nr:gliding motility-associated C-terminal domain-containing protein [Saprospiraceae bacterium]